MIERTYLHTTIDELFPPAPLHAPNAETQRLFVTRWSQQLEDMCLFLALQRDFQPHILEEARNSLNVFAEHPDHGAKHSYNVYIGMQHLAHREGWSEQQIKTSDSVFQSMAVLHDLAQLLPYKNPINGTPQKGDQRRKHADVMAFLVMKLGRKFHLSFEERKILAQDILHHDDTWLKGTVCDVLSPAGKLLADSDKLFGASLPRPDGTYDTHQLVSDALHRNLSGALSPTGWYVYRTDISPEQRAAWRYGDRWSGDTLSAIQFEMFRQHFYTKYGKHIGQQKREVFWNVAEQFYGNLYDEMQTRMKIIVDNNAPIYFCSKGVNNQTAILRSKYTEIDDIIEDAYVRTINVSRPEGNTLWPKGWMLMATIADESILIDPSILRFMDREDFVDRIQQVFKKGGHL